MTTVLSCKNCDQPLTAEARFCPACGQSTRNFIRPWAQFMREAVSELFDFDGRMLSSVRLLLTRPGFLSLEYFNDRRVSYTSPLRLYLVISLIFFLVLPFIIQQLIAVYPDHAIPVDLYSKAMFVLLPVFALVLKMLYRKVFYLSHLVFSVHLFSAMYIVFAILISIEALADRYIAVMLVQFVLLTYMLAYCVVALRTAYQAGWLVSIGKFLLLLLLFSPALAVLIELPAHL